MHHLISLILGPSLLPCALPTGLQKTLSRRVAEARPWKRGDGAVELHGAAGDRSPDFLLLLLRQNLLSVRIDPGSISSEAE